MEERNTAGFTPFHIALQRGHVRIIKYILGAHGPEDAEAIYNRPPFGSLLSTALESGQPEAVWMVLNNKLATREDMTNAWIFVTRDSRKTFMDMPGLTYSDEKVEEIKSLLMTFGGFSKETEPILKQDSAFGANRQVLSTSTRTALSADEPVSPHGAWRPIHNKQQENHGPRVPLSRVKQSSTYANQQTALGGYCVEPVQSPYHGENVPLPRDMIRGQGRSRGFMKRGRG